LDVCPVVKALNVKIIGHDVVGYLGHQEEISSFLKPIVYAMVVYLLKKSNCSGFRIWIIFV